MKKKATLYSGFLVLVTLILVATAEMGARVAGTIDFPIYRVDDQIGYLPEPNQHGEYLRQNRWVVNDRSMSTGRWEPNAARDLLLIGGSLVWGGNLLSQPQKIGPLLERKMLGWRVWPISAASWSVANEVAYLERNPDVQAETDVIVWVLNTEDFQGPSKWISEDIHPRKKPLSALWYLFQKYVLSPFAPGGPGDRPAGIRAETESAFRDRLAQLQRQNPDREMLFMLYPKKDELRPAAAGAEAFYEKYRDRLREDLGAKATLVEVRDDSRWNAGLYRDDIHLSASGNAVLVDLIVEHLKAKPVDPAMLFATPR